VTPIFLSNKVPWFGNHTGYQQLPRYMQKLVSETKIVSSKNCLTEKMLGKAYSLYRGWNDRNQPDAAAEFRFICANSVPDPVRHILHFEEHYLFFDRWEKAPRNFLATLHIPQGEVTPGEVDGMKRLSSAIVLYQKDIEYFESFVGKDRVRFIPHGVDVEFFSPRGTEPQPNKLLFTGHYLRNTKMLARVISRLAAQHSGLEFHLLVPEAFRHLDGFEELKARNDIVWHQKLDDEALCRLISSSYLVMLPMRDSGANTAVVEALACGTPLVTTDVGGIRDYGGGTLFPVVKNDDDDAMVDLVNEYLNSSTRRNEVSRACREFAVTQLAWPIVAQQHLKTYESLAS
jgi:glycosyltransferase involved in cell wall biosynthesis